MTEEGRREEVKVLVVTQHQHHHSGDTGEMLLTESHHLVRHFEVFCCDGPMTDMMKTL